MFNNLTLKYDFDRNRCFESHNVCFEIACTMQFLKAIFVKRSYEMNEDGDCGICFHMLL